MRSRRPSLLYAVLAFAFCAGCTTTVRPPPVVAEPATVYLLQHGRSSSLVLTEVEDRASRWAFGDWRFYALGDKTTGAALAAILWPTSSALGRQLLTPGPDGERRLLEQLGIGVDRVFLIEVERSAVDRLQARLMALFRENSASALYNPGPRLEFVKHPEPYTLLNSSNRRVARWLRELGCETEGITLLSRWRVEADRR